MIPEAPGRTGEDKNVPQKANYPRDCRHSRARSARDQRPVRNPIPPRSTHRERGRARGSRPLPLRHHAPGDRNRRARHVEPLLSDRTTLPLPKDQLHDPIFRRGERGRKRWGQEGSRAKPAIIRGRAIAEPSRHEAAGNGTDSAFPSPSPPTPDGPAALGARGVREGMPPCGWHKRVPTATLPGPGFPRPPPAAAGPPGPSLGPGPDRGAAARGSSPGWGQRHRGDLGADRLRPAPLPAPVDAQALPGRAVRGPRGWGSCRGGEGAAKGSSPPVT